MKILRIVPALAVAAACIGGVAATPALAQGPGSASAPAPKVLKQLRTWSYVGPEGVLAGAKITLSDRTGRVIATGTTTPSGTYTFDLAKKGALKTPLEVNVSGGKARGVAFTGNLTARAFVGNSTEPTVQVSLISTAASQMSAKRKGYAAATAKVRRTLGIGAGAFPSALRLRNSSVGYPQLMAAVRRAGGFDQFAGRLVAAARAGKRIGGLQPSARARARFRDAISRVAVAGVKQQNDTSQPMCSLAVPSTGSTSDELITDVVEIGAGVLAKYSGIPSAAAAGVAGMALAPLGVDNTSPEEAQLSAIAKDLGCIMAQLNYLEQQMKQLQFTMDLQGAIDCSNKITGDQGFDGYEYMINNRAQYPINRRNTSLTQVWLPTWQVIAQDCGSAINNMLFGTGGSQAATWQQLVSNTLGTKGQWFSQAQVQRLQTFLSWWGGLLYQQYILANEYYNYNAAFPAAANAAGYAIKDGKVLTDSAGNPLCDYYAGNSSICVQTSNIANAYPEDLYSDELGVVATGYTVRPVPLGIMAPKPIMSPAPSGSAATNSKYFATQDAANRSYSATAMNPAWWFNYFLNFTGTNSAHNGNRLLFYNYGEVQCEQKTVSPCPTSTPAKSWTWDAVSYVNSRLNNPKGYGSAVQTFDNSQKYNYSAEPSNSCSTYFAPVNSTNGDGVTGLQALYNALNQTPNGGTGPVSSVTKDQILYWTNDWGSYMTSGINTATPVKLSWKGCFGSMSSDWNGSQQYLPSTPIFAVLLTRNWWPTAKNATSYTPPPPARGPKPPTS